MKPEILGVGARLGRRLVQCSDESRWLRDERGGRMPSAIASIEPMRLRFDTAGYHG